jgi:aldehyde dehydrogenase (NAD+)
MSGAVTEKVSSGAGRNAASPPLEGRNYINGRWVPARGGKTFEVRNPARWNEIVGTCASSAAEDVAEAVRAARAAYDTWRLVPAPRRGELLRRTGEILLRRKDEIATIMTREMGKVLSETRGDVQEGIDTAFYAAGEGRRLFGETTTAELPDKFAMSVRLPIGVCGLITPWNFPLAIPTWKMFPALVCGNTVVLKPATDTPLSAMLLVQATEEAGFPPGVVNFVTGGGSTVGNALIDHEDVRLISFTGSTEVGRAISERCGRGLKRLSLEMGGKNAQIVLRDADLDLALEGALWGAFGTTGQRCTATSRIILDEPIADRFTEMFCERARGLMLGDGLAPRTQVGPLVNESQRKTVHSYVEIGKSEGATLALGGSIYDEGDAAGGWFYRPTVFTDVRPDMRIAQEEIFGPVVSIIRVNGADEAIRVLNGTRYGLSSSIYTRDVAIAMRAIRDIEAGITYINGPTIGAEVQLPFGGVKETGNGHREAGTTVLDIFTEWKSVYIDYSGRLQRAQIDTEEL